MLGGKADACPFLEAPLFPVWGFWPPVPFWAPGSPAACAWAAWGGGSGFGSQGNWATLSWVSFFCQPYIICISQHILNSVLHPVLPVPIWHEWLCRCSMTERIHVTVVRGSSQWGLGLWWVGGKGLGREGELKRPYSAGSPTPRHSCSPPLLR